MYNFIIFPGRLSDPAIEGGGLSPLLHVALIKPLNVFLSALSATYSKLFSLYFKFSGEPWSSQTYYM